LVGWLKSSQARRMSGWPELAICKNASLSLAQVGMEKG